MRTVAIVNQKGGSGKTTTAINLASILAKRGQRTLLVDIDPQSHCALGLAVPDQRIECSIADALAAGPDAQPDPSRLIWNINKHLDLIPSATRLAGLESARGGLAEASDREERLLHVLRPHAPSYEWCLIDCSPSIGLLTFNALRAASFVLIPVETGYFALRGAERQIRAIEALIRRCAHRASYRVFATMHRPDTRVGQDVLAQLRERFDECLIPVVVRFDEALREAASLGHSIVDHAPDSQAARDYTSLTAWMLEHVPEPPEGFADATTDGAASEQIVPNGHARSEDSDAGGDTPDLAPVTTRVAVAATGTVSRAAELAARARQLAHRNSEMHRRIETDERAGAIMKEISALHAPSTEPAHEERQRPARLSPDELASYYGARVTSSGVLFVYPAGPNVEVCVACDINGWSPNAHRMSYNPELAAHEIRIPFPRGRHPYRYVVNGQWITDPHNPCTAPNPFGQLDSIVVVGAPEPDTIPPQDS